MRRCLTVIFFLQTSEMCGDMDGTGHKLPKFLGLTFQHFWAMLCRERFHLTTDSKDYNDVSFEKYPFYQPGVQLLTPGSTKGVPI